MTEVRIPTDSKFNYKQCKKYFKKYRSKIADNTEFKDIVKNTFFYSFYDDDKFIACIYYYERDNKLFLNGFSSRHHHLKNIECLKMSLNWFNCDIYAESVEKTARLCLLRCNFKKISDNLFIYRGK